MARLPSPLEKELNKLERQLLIVYILVISITAFLAIYALIKMIKILYRKFRIPNSVMKKQNHPKNELSVDPKIIEKYCTVSSVGNTAIMVSSQYGLEKGAKQIQGKGVVVAKYSR